MNRDQLLNAIRECKFSISLVEKELEQKPRDRQLQCRLFELKEKSKNLKKKYNSLLDEELVL